MPAFYTHFIIRFGTKLVFYFENQAERAKNEPGYFVEILKKHHVKFFFLMSKVAAFASL